MVDYNNIKAIRSSELDAAMLGVDYVEALRLENKTSDAMSFGTMFHTYYLEHDKFGSLYVNEPPEIRIKDEKGKEFQWKIGDNRTNKAYKLWKAKQNREIYKYEDFQRILTMRLSIDANPWVQENIKLYGSKTQIEMPRLFEIDGVQCKAKPDYLDDKICVDLKTIDVKNKYGELRGLTEERIRWEIRQRKYIRQQAFYRMSGINTREMYLLFVESKPPHNTMVVHLDRDDLDEQEEAIRDILKRYLEFSLGCERQTFMSSRFDNQNYDEGEVTL